MRLAFTKMHGAGNDFIVLDATHAPLELSASQVQRLADRRFGVGADQILVVEASNDDAIDFRYRIYNGGSGDEVEHCGNGARCFVRYVRDKRLSDKTVLRVATVNNVLELRLATDGRVTVDMNRPRFAPDQVPFDTSGPAPRDGLLWPLDGIGDVFVLSMGNPHAVLRVDDVAAFPVATVGPRVERHPRFLQGVNAGFMQLQSRTAIALRVWERGAGETLACGTGACAAVVAGIRLGWLDRRVDVHTAGGVLAIDWPHDDAGVLMTGPATTVFEGEIEL